MIYEFRTYTLKPRSLAEVEKRYGEAYEYRKKYSPLAAFWHTEVGPLNEIIHVWGYTDLAERGRIRAEAAKDANWPPKIREFVIDQDVEVVTPFPFIPDIKPATVGPIFEIRRYSLTPGSLPGVMKRWEGSIGERAKLSPVVLAGGVEFGGANRFIHIWAYKSMDQRLAIREQARKAGVWPPPGGGGDELLAQTNKIVMPSSFSPLQ
jgi:NIPSNAP